MREDCMGVRVTGSMGGSEEHTTETRREIRVWASAGERGSDAWRG